MNRPPGRRAVLVLAVTVACLILVGCGPKPGPAGTVTSKDRAYWATSKRWTYELTVRTPDGAETEFRVPKSHYRACYRGSAYPACTTAR